MALRSDVKPDSEHVEYMALGHPVVDDLIARATSSCVRRLCSCVRSRRQTTCQREPDG